MNNLILRQLAGGQCVPGTRIADYLGVSRAIVQSKIRNLKENGIEIQSVPGRGYRLVSSINVLDEGKLRDHTGQRVQVLQETDSTNEEIKRCLQQGREVGYLFAELQTAGKGRQGRTWLAAPYQSILGSTYFRLAGSFVQASGLSLAVGIGVCRALKSNGFGSVSLKWPNDLLISGEKLGGILVEIVGEREGQLDIIVGFGLNVRLPRKLAEQCGQLVTDLVSHTAATVDRNFLVVSIVNTLDQVIRQFSRDGFAPLVSEWQSLHYFQEKPVRIALGNYQVEGLAMGVDSSGALRIRTDDGQTRVLTTGEVMS